MIIKGKLNEIENDQSERKKKILSNLSLIRYLIDDTIEVVRGEESLHKLYCIKALARLLYESFDKRDKLYYLEPYATIYKKDALRDSVIKGFTELVKPIGWNVDKEFKNLIKYNIDTIYYYLGRKSAKTKSGYTIIDNFIITIPKYNLALNKYDENNTISFKLGLQIYDILIGKRLVRKLEVAIYYNNRIYNSKNIKLFSQYLYTDKPYLAEKWIKI